MNTSTYIIPLVITLKVALLATLFAHVFGVGAGYFLSRTRFPGREAVDALLTLPLVLPPTVLGYYLLVLLGRQGILGGVLQKVFGGTPVFTWRGAVVAATVVSFPLVFKSARNAFDGVDPGLERAARTLGTAEGWVFLRVSLPLAWRGILAGTMLAFARAMGEFGATLMVAGNIPGETQTLSLALYDAVLVGNDSTATVFVVLTSVTCMAVVVASGLLLRGRVS